jgi:II/X family phage/plasmid replication protein
VCLDLLSSVGRVVIDWLTARIDLGLFPEADRDVLLGLSDWVMRFSGEGVPPGADPTAPPVMQIAQGDVRYLTKAWDSVRSDSHGVVCRVTPSSLWIQGSPARCIGDGDAVFSSGASAAEDVRGCLHRMVSFLLGQVGVATRPDLALWDVTRLDITRNLMLDSLAEVRQALAYLRNAEGGRYRVNQPDGDTVYWNKSSRYKKAKAYAKGPHLLYQQKRPEYHGRRYTELEVSLASKLIRLELSIFKRYWVKNLGLPSWQFLTPTILNDEWRNYFGQLLGHTIMNDEELRRRVESVAPTAGQAKAAYNCWYLIKSMGWEMARENHTRSTWYRNLGILKAAGLKVTDLGNGKVIPFRVQKLVLGREVATWTDLRRAA